LSFLLAFFTSSSSLDFGALVVAALGEFVGEFSRPCVPWDDEEIERGRFRDTPLQRNIATRFHPFCTYRLSADGLCRSLCYLGTTLFIFFAVGGTSVANTPTCSFSFLLSFFRVRAHRSSQPPPSFLFIQPTAQRMPSTPMPILPSFSTSVL